MNKQKYIIAAIAIIIVGTMAVTGNLFPKYSVKIDTDYVENHEESEFDSEINTEFESNGEDGQKVDLGGYYDDSKNNIEFDILGHDEYISDRNISNDDAIGQVVEDKTDIFDIETSDNKTGTLNTNLKVAEFSLKGSDLNQISSTEDYIEVYSKNENSDIYAISKEKYDAFGRVEDKKVSCKLNRDTEWEVNINSGVLNGTIDLSEINAKKLNVNSGAAELDIVLGDTSKDVIITTGISNIKVKTSENVGIRFITRGVLSNRTFSADKYTRRDDDYFYSSNYDESEEKITFELNMVAGDFELLDE